MKTVEEREARRQRKRYKRALKQIAKRQRADAVELMVQRRKAARSR